MDSTAASSTRSYASDYQPLLKMQEKAAKLKEELREAAASQAGSAPSTARPKSALRRPTSPPSQAARPGTPGSADGTAGRRSLSPNEQANTRLLMGSNRRQSIILGGAIRPGGHFAELTRLEGELGVLQRRHDDTLHELDRRQESYMRREEQLRDRIAALERQLGTQEDAATLEDSKASSMNGSAGDVSSSNTGNSSGGSTARGSTKHSNHAEAVPSISELQGQAEEGFGELMEKQRLQLRAEEAQQLRQFRAKLADVEAQLAKERQAQAASHGDWMGKTVALREELAQTQDIATKLDEMYKLAEEQAASLRVQFKAQEDDRELIIKQMLGYKKENHQLKRQLTLLQREMDEITDLVEAHAGGTGLDIHSRPTTREAGRAGTLSRPASAMPRSGRDSHGSGGRRPMSAQPWHATAGADALEGANFSMEAVQTRMQRYSRVIDNMKKLLESERKLVRQLRSERAADYARRSELQQLLLTSIEEVKDRRRLAEGVHRKQQQQQPQQEQQHREVPATQPASSSSDRQQSTASTSQPAFASHPHSSSRQRPVSAANSRHGTKLSLEVSGRRPMTAVPVGGSINPQLYDEPPTSPFKAIPGHAEQAGSSAAWHASAHVGAAATGAARRADAAANAPLTQEEWDSLLQELLSREQTLKLLFDHSFGNSLPPGTAAHAKAPSTETGSKADGVDAQVGRRGRQAGATSCFAEPGEFGPPSDMQAFAEDDGCDSDGAAVAEDLGDDDDDDDYGVFEDTCSMSASLPSSAHRSGPLSQRQRHGQQQQTQQQARSRPGQAAAGQLLGGSAGEAPQRAQHAWQEYVSDNGSAAKGSFRPMSAQVPSKQQQQPQQQRRRLQSAVSRSQKGMVVDGPPLAGGKAWAPDASREMHQFLQSGNMHAGPAT